MLRAPDLKCVDWTVHDAGRHGIPFDVGFISGEGGQRNPPRSRTSLQASRRVASLGAAKLERSLYSTGIKADFLHFHSSYQTCQDWLIICFATFQCAGCMQICACLVHRHLPLGGTIRKDLNPWYARLEGPGVHPARDILPSGRVHSLPEVVAGRIVEAVLEEIILKAMEELFFLHWRRWVLTGELTSKTPCKILCVDTERRYRGRNGGWRCILQVKISSVLPDCRKPTLNLNKPAQVVFAWRR